MQSHRFLLLILLLGMVAALGCTAKEEPTVAVSGKVLVDGKLLTLGTVTFAPDKEKGNKGVDLATGPVQPDGSYKLTYKGKDGAPVGWYKVGVNPAGMPMTMPEKGKPMPSPTAIGERFKSPDTSKISIEVTASPAAEAYTIKVTK
jgi:hypothetical protein